MTEPSTPAVTPRMWLRAGGTTIAVALATACFTVLFLCARAVMEMGGSCASGGPFAVARPCPQGVGWLTPTSIFLGLGTLVALAAVNWNLPGPKLALLAWPALFLSLGWNFWEYGLDPPQGGGDTAGWIVCGVIFVGMGGLPLLAFLGKDAWKATFWADGKTERRTESVPRTAASSVRPPLPRPVERAIAKAGQPPAGAPRTAPRDVTAELERLAALHASGALTDDEFTAAKRKVITP